MHFKPELAIQGMREELTELGVTELKTESEVTEAMQNKEGTMLIVVNSVCGCAAGNARPAVKIALQNEKKPGKLYTVFAGQDKEATAKAREYFVGVEPSSPSFVLMKEGGVVFNIPRMMIEGRSAEDIASDLVGAFNQFC